MTLCSPTALAEAIDRLAEAHGALVTESEHDVLVCNLQVPAAQHLAQLCRAAGWEPVLVDSANNPFAPADLCADYAPFRLTVSKRLPRENDTLYLLTTAGLRSMLASGHPAACWRLARIGQRLVTQARVYGNWSEPLPRVTATRLRSPRALVRETAGQGHVPEDLRYWLLAAGEHIDARDPIHRLWAAQALHALACSLADGVDGHHHGLTFRGPPPLRLRISPALVHCPATLALLCDRLQAAARWVFEVERETEVRHAMLATEIARAGRADGDAWGYLTAHLAEAMDSARVVYQLHLSEMTVDTLNALSHLRSNVNDDAARTTEATQQALTKVAAGLGVGLTLIVTGVSNDVGFRVTLLTMLIACMYCAVEIAAGWRLIKIRRIARDAWQPRWYRFLPRSDYRAMVSRPADRSECVYLWATLSGLALVALMGLLVAFYSATQADGPSGGQPPTSRLKTFARHQAPENGQPLRYCDLDIRADVRTASGAGCASASVAKPRASASSTSSHQAAPGLG